MRIHMNRLLPIPLILTLPLTASSCDETTEPQAIPVAAASSNSRLASLGPQVHLFKECDTAIKIPTKTYTLTVDTLDIHKLAERWKVKISAIETEIPTPTDKLPAPKKRTKWDLDLKLQSGETALLTIVLNGKEKNRLSFMEDGYAITAGDYDSIARFCRYGKYDPSTATIVAFYDKDMKEYPSTINIGINVVDKSNDGYVTPVHVDPNVKNNG
jgi:hypothetical protein